jgi:D-beta-D-heptose 7-phosphate kinase/D-beta-D-heptose 1-phosphate adenosyltransferase
VTPARFRELIGRFAAARVLVAGDVMLDEFIWGRVSRISPEAPVPVVNVTGESYYPGGAANVARNLREFTGHTAVIGVAGSDSAGARLCELLYAAGIDVSGVWQLPGATTTVKTRIIARNQQVVRVDREQPLALDKEAHARACAHLAKVMPAIDAVLVADYGKGFVTQALADEICRLANQHGKVVTVDPHPHTRLAWRGVTAIKPNRAEVFHAAGLPPADASEPACRDAGLLAAARRLQQIWSSGSLLVTLGEQGMLLLEGDQQPLYLPARAQEVFDVSGAGDTALAIFTLGIVAGGTPAEAAELANRASGIVVGKIGTATVRINELIAACA